MWKQLSTAYQNMYQVKEEVNPNCDCVDCNCDPCECGDWREGQGPEGTAVSTADAEGLGEETLQELSSEEKKLISMMYDKKGNLTKIGKKVMDHGKKVAVNKFPRNVSATQGKRMETMEAVNPPLSTQVGKSKYISVRKYTDIRGEEAFQLVQLRSQSAATAGDYIIIPASEAKQIAKMLK
jgi:hypothetical protein